MNSFKTELARETYSSFCSAAEIPDVWDTLDVKLQTAWLVAAMTAASSIDAAFTPVKIALMDEFFQEQS